MRSISKRILSLQALATGDALDLADYLDLGDSDTLDIAVVVHEAGEGEGAQLVFEHAPCNDPDFFFAFDPGIAVDLTVADRTWLRYASFMRYLRWRVEGTLNASPTVTVDLLGRG